MTNIVAEENLVSADVLAERLGVSADVVYRMAARGDIPHYRVGRLRKFHVGEVLLMLKRDAKRGS